MEKLFEGAKIHIWTEDKKCFMTIENPNTNALYYVSTTILLANFDKNIGCDVHLEVVCQSIK